MNVLLSPWNAVLTASLHASALIVVALALRWLLRGRWPAQGMYLLWMLVVLRLLVSAAPDASWSIFNLAAWRPQTEIASDGLQVRTTVTAGSGAEESAQGTTAVDEAGTASRVDEASQVHASKHQGKVWPVEMWCAVVWVAGVAVQVGLLGWSAMMLGRRLKGAVAIEDERFLRMAGECGELLGLRRRVGFVESTAVSGPVVLGMWRPRLVMPLGLSAELTDEELRFVLLHELAHVRRQDLAMLWLLTAARVVHWFNPLAWLAARLARHDVELACDETVLRCAGAETSEAYGATLLRFVRIAPWRAGVPAAGIMERARVLKERLTRIGGYTPPTMARMAFTMLVVLSVGVVFAVDEKKPEARDEKPAANPPRPVEPEKSVAPTSPSSFAGGVPATAEIANPMPDWAKGWAVEKLTIPVNAEKVEEAYVDLRTPEGKTIQLYPGRPEEGIEVVVDAVRLGWSPVRALVRLRKGDSFAELVADGALISQSKTLRKPKPQRQFSVETWFVEMPEAFALTLKTPDGKALFRPRERDLLPKLPNEEAVGVAIIKPDEGKPYMDLTSPKSKGVTFLSSPRVTTRSGQRAVIEIIREFRYPVWEENGVKVKKGEGPVEFQTMNLGATMEVEPKVSKEGLVDLRVTPTVTECLGMVDIDTGKAVMPLRPRPQDGVEPTFPSRISFPKATKGQRQKPVFSRRQVTTDLTMPLGHILVLTNLREREKTQPFNMKEPEVRLMVVVRVEEIEDAAEPSSRSVNVFPVPPVAPKAQP